MKVMDHMMHGVIVIESLNFNIFLNGKSFLLKNRNVLMFIKLEKDKHFCSCEDCSSFPLLAQGCSLAGGVHPVVEGLFVCMFVSGDSLLRRQGCGVIVTGR